MNSRSHQVPLIVGGRGSSPAPDPRGAGGLAAPADFHVRSFTMRGAAARSPFTGAASADMPGTSRASAVGV